MSLVILTDFKWIVIKKRNAFPGHCKDEMPPYHLMGLSINISCFFLAFCSIPLTLFLILNTEGWINHCSSCFWNLSGSKHLYLLNAIRAWWWSSSAWIFNPPLVIKKAHKTDLSLPGSILSVEALDTTWKGKGLIFHGYLKVGRKRTTDALWSTALQIKPSFFVEGKAGMFLILLQKPAVVDLFHSTTKFYPLHAWRVVSGGDDRCYQP